MAANQTDSGNEEIILSGQSRERWGRRRREIAEWVELVKPPSRHPKKTALLDGIEVDVELHRALMLFQQMNISTEFSCAGVSVLDEPEDHSLYAYITFHESKQTEQFVQFAMAYMRHRLLVIHEPSRSRYDLSSFFIGHNRSFCMLVGRCAEQFLESQRQAVTVNRQDSSERSS
ncbi:hypothetical protein ACFOLF_01165 [Paenibacillus sepulcri]|uniref:hypothetical protein n=1 Tax=Paenibacillus sepulcri TaxID=359917 RepID=UPI0035E85F42